MHDPIPRLSFAHSIEGGSRKTKTAADAAAE
jgi:hypothetical protein